MKIFISQKMRGKTHKEIEIERERIKNELIISKVNGAYNWTFSKECFIESYKPELKFKDPITSLSQSLAMLAEADIVLVPKEAIEGIVPTLDGNMMFFGGFAISNLKGCEFEFLIAKSYGKKVYTYDDNYTFEEV